MVLKELVPWKRLLEDSEVFLCIVTKNFFQNNNCLEQAIYAKNLNKPFALIVEKGTEMTIPDLFEGVDIVLQLEYTSALDLKKKAPEIIRTLSEFKKEAR